MNHFLPLFFPQVSELKQWGEVAKALGFDKEDVTSAAAQVRQIFVRYIVPFEVYLKTTIAKDQNVSNMTSMKSMKSMKSTKPQPSSKEEPQQLSDQKADVVVVVDMDVDVKNLDANESVIALDSDSPAEATLPKKAPKKTLGG